MSGRIVGSYFPGLPSQAKTAATFCAVCIEDNGSFAVYIGLVEARHAPDVRDRPAAEEWCMRFGTKVRYDQAVLYFPTLKPAQYRA